MKKCTKTIPFILFTAISFNSLACSISEETEPLSNKLSTGTSSISFSQSEGRSFITTFGTIQNASSACAQSVVIEVTYFDAQGKQIDVVTQPLYGVVVPPSKEVSFRVREEADKPKEMYASSKVRVLDADSKYSSPRSSRNERSPWLDLLVSLGPILLLILLWAFIMRKYSGKNSTPQRTLALVEKQNEILSRQVEALERLAQVAEQKVSSQ